MEISFKWSVDCGLSKTRNLAIRFEHCFIQMAPMQIAWDSSEPFISTIHHLHMSQTPSLILSLDLQCRSQPRSMPVPSVLSTVTSIYNREIVVQVSVKKYQVYNVLNTSTKFEEIKCIFCDFCTVLSHACAGRLLIVLASCKYQHTPQFCSPPRVSWKTKAFNHF